LKLRTTTLPVSTTTRSIHSLAAPGPAIESMTRLGKRLLVGDSAPYLPLQGACFLIDAAKARGPKLRRYCRFCRRLARMPGSAGMRASARSCLPLSAEQESSNHHESVDHTFLAYLNDDYEGGETHFPELGVRHEGTRGEGLYFVSVKHAGLPLTQGDKWTVSQSIRNRTSVD
jgi:hypothetical protein